MASLQAPSPVYLFKIKRVLTASTAVVSTNKRYPTDAIAVEPNPAVFGARRDPSAAALRVQ
jgi:hypothetical protein